VVWSNAPEKDAPGLPAPGPVRFAFVGWGDGGFSLRSSGEQWQVDPARPTMTLRRDEAGNLAWHLLLVNHAAELVPDRAVELALQVHPRRRRPAAARRLSWLAWEPEGDVAAHAGLEPRGHALLSGRRGGAAGSAEATLADAWPLPLWRFLAGTHTGTLARLATDAAELVRPGGPRDADRMALGRALLHDVGLDVSTLTHRLEAAKLLRTLHEFGFFADDGAGEFVPYWRSEAYVRYGEDFQAQAEDSFATTQADPMARVHVSLLRRPAGNGTHQVLFFVVNEGPEPVREQFYVLDAPALFGEHRGRGNRRAGNHLTRGAVAARWPDHGVPESDWDGRPPAVGVNTKDERAKAILSLCLLDLVDDGIVAWGKMKSEQVRRVGQQEVYGILHVPARGMRVLYATGGTPPWQDTQE
jgi:hypothetical protein